MPIRHLFHKPAVANTTIGRTPPDLRSQALSAATGQAVASVPGFERRAGARGMDLSLLWSAHSAEGVAAAVLVVPSPGRTAAVLFSHGNSPEQAACIGRVLDQAATDLAAEGAIALLQCLPRPSEEARAASLLAGGFQRLARLDYMERPNSAPAAAAPSTLPGGFTLQPWDRRRPQLLIDLLQRTFVGTLDCPGLASMRRGSDILEGHVHSGDGDTSMWRILCDGESPVGAMLLSPCSATDSVDIIYLGLVPEARGRSIAAAMLTHGLRDAATVDVRSVQLAVDVANAPAVLLYRRAGFSVRQQREAWVRPLSSASSCPQCMDTHGQK
jgi:ribosomal protein S18 acetylase RimI-like enzyme